MLWFSAMKSSTESRTLVLGAGGLIGSAVLRQLHQRGYTSLFGVSLKDDHSVARIDELMKEKIKPVMFWKNVLVSKELEKYSNTEIFLDDDNLLTLLKFLKLPPAELITQSSLFALIREIQPVNIINCINTATILSYNFNRHAEDKYTYFKNKEFDFLIKHYQILANVLSKKFWWDNGESMEIANYVKVGTTGVGGMGLDIPFTHGEESPSLSLLKKISMAGAETMLLLALSNTKHLPKVSEIKPAGAVFEGSIRRARDSRNSAPLRLDDIKTIRPADVSEKTLAQYYRPPQRTIQDYYVDGGESGHYSIEEFRLITDERFMGMISCDFVAEEVVNDLEGETRYNVLTSLHTSLLRANEEMFRIRDNMLVNIEKDSRSTQLVTGNLGPQRTSKLLLEAQLFRVAALSDPNLLKLSESDIAEKLKVELFAPEFGRYAQLVGLPAVLPNGEVAIFGHISFPRIDELKEGDKKMSPSDLDTLCQRGWIDLRVKNTSVWKQWIRRYYRASPLPPAGIIVADLINTEQSFSHQETASQ